jgi:tryptophan synthase alpha chain
LPPEEAQTLLDLSADTPLDLVFLAAPTSTAARLARISEASRGFIYYVSRLGTTGVREQLAEDLRMMLETVRASTSLPIVVGFGVSTPEHVQSVARLADGVVVASAILKLLEDLDGREDRLEHVGNFVADLKVGTRLAPIEPRPLAS